MMKTCFTKSNYKTVDEGGLSLIILTRYSGGRKKLCGVSGICTLKE